MAKFNPDDLFKAKEFSDEQIAGLRADIDKATRMAGHAAGDFAMDNRRYLSMCTPAAATDLLVKAAISYLLTNGLATLAPAEAWETYLPVTVPQPFADDLTEQLANAVAEQERLNAALHRMQGR